MNEVTIRRLTAEIRNRREFQLSAVFNYTINRHIFQTAFFIAIFPKICYTEQMKKHITLLKVIMLFVTAVWGLLLGVLSPLTILLDPHELIGAQIPDYIPILWILTSVCGFVIPCFLVMLKRCKIAAAVCGVGTVSLIVTHVVIMKYSIPDFAWFYMPLLADTVVIWLIALYSNMGEIRQKRYQKQKAKNAPTPSILGNGEYQVPQKNANNKQKKSNKSNKSKSKKRKR